MKLELINLLIGLIVIINKPMNILHVIYSGLGGQGQFLFELIKGLKNTNTNFKNIIIFYGIESVLNDYLKFCKNNNIEHYYVNSSKFFSGVYYFYLLTKINPQSIFVHTSVIFKSIVYRLFFKTKLIYIDHTSNNVKKLSHWINLYLSCLFFKKVIFLAKFHKKEILGKEFFSRFKKKFKLIKPGVSLKKKIIVNKKPQKKHKSILLGMASRIVKGKKHIDLINVVKRLNKNKKIDVKLSIIGDGPEAKNVKNYLKKNKLKYSIKLDGFKNESNTKKWFKKIDIYIHWSVGEVVSRSILEAMQNQKIIFAFEIPSIKEQLSGSFQCAILFKN